MKVAAVCRPAPPARLSKMPVSATGHSNSRGSVCILALPVMLCGCVQDGAPSFDMFGAFFPAWLLCAVLGIFVALGARVAFTARGLTDVLPFQLPLCASIGVIFALLAWLIWFGR
jgi:YtcA-like protein